MSLEKRFLLTLFSLALLLGIGIVIPGYFKMRTLEHKEAREYTLASSSRMLHQVEHQINILKQAGVGDIENYISSSKNSLIKEFTSSQTDTRANKLTIDLNDKKIFGAAEEQNFDFNLTLLNQLSLTQASTVTYSTNKGTWLISSQASPEWGWLLLSSMPTKEVYRESREYLWFVLLISAIVLTMVMTLYYLITKKLRKRLKQILAQLELYKYGEFNKRLEVTDPDEISTLQKSINSVIDNVETEIDSRKTSEYLLQEDRRAAERESLDKQEHLARISYLTKNPINNVAGFATLLSKTKLSKKQKKYIGKIEEANEALNTLINEAFNLPNRTSVVSDTVGLDSKAIEEIAEVDILLIETDSLSKAYVTEILNYENVEVTTFTKVKDALEYLNTHDVDIVVINIGTPAAVYSSAIKHIRTKLPSYLRDIPVIALTTDATDVDIERYLAAGASTTIAKPFNPATLVQAIAKHLS